MNIVPFPIQWISMRLIQINKDHCKWDFRPLLNFPPWKIDIEFRLIFCDSSCGITARDFAKYDEKLRSYQNLTGINNSAFKEMWDAGISNRKFEWPWEMKLTRCYIWFKLLYDLKTPMYFKIREILDWQQPVIHKLNHNQRREAKKRQANILEQKRTKLEFSSWHHLIKFFW